MKRLICILIALTIFAPSVAIAQEARTLLPETQKGEKECGELLDLLEKVKNEKVEHPETKEVLLESAANSREYFAHNTRDYRNNVLACAIITGRVKFWMIPFYIVYLIEFAIGISGLVAIAFLVYGGFQYVIGGAIEKQENAKNTIKFALMGLVLVLVAWVLVNLVQFLVTI